MAVMPREEESHWCPVEVFRDAEMDRTIIKQWLNTNEHIPYTKTRMNQNCTVKQFCLAQDKIRKWEGHSEQYYCK